MGRSKALSLAGSNKYDWDNYESDAKKLDMNDSQFFQFLYDYWKKRKSIDYAVPYLITLLSLAILVLLLFLFFR